MDNQVEQFAIQGKGVVGTVTTAAASSVTWIEQANQFVDLAAGIVAVVAGLCTISWYVYRFIKLRGEAQDDQINSSK